MIAKRINDKSTVVFWSRPFLFDENYQIVLTHHDNNDNELTIKHTYGTFIVSGRDYATLVLRRGPKAIFVTYGY